MGFRAARSRPSYFHYAHMPTLMWLLKPVACADWFEKRITILWTQNFRAKSAFQLKEEPLELQHFKRQIHDTYKAFKNSYDPEKTPLFQTLELLL